MRSDRSACCSRSQIAYHLETPWGRGWLSRQICRSVLGRRLIAEYRYDVLRCRVTVTSAGRLRPAWRAMQGTGQRGRAEATSKAPNR